MKKFLLFTTFCLAIFASKAQGNVVYANHTDKRSVVGFHAIDASSGIKVILTSGDEGAVVTADNKEALDKVITQVENGVLKITRDSDWRFWKLAEEWKVAVYVSYKQLDALKAHSGATIHGDLSSNTLRINQSSGSVITLGGQVDQLEVAVSSGAIFKGYDLQTTNLKADASSGGGVQAKVLKLVDAEASSGGFIRFKGEATIRNIDVSSGGSVKKVS